MKRVSFRLKAPATAILLLTIDLLMQGSLCAAQEQESAPVAQTANGQLRGVERARGGAEFLGIPYAEAPVGELRWHEPLPAKPWKGIRDARVFGAPCAQPDLGGWNLHDADAGKEDCLFLNVITTVWPAKTPLPVMVWLHGGANEGGSASSSLYKDGTLVNHGVLLVTVNYRLGIFGFFSHPELTRESAHHGSGNYGLMDQILALRWVRANIARFGGDPKNVTLFGQSAGAEDTSLLMTSSLSKGLFQRAIAESSASFSPPPVPLAEAEGAGETFVANLKVPTVKDAKGEGVVKVLRKLSTEELLTALVSQKPRQHFGPDIDGWVIARPPAAVFQSGQEAAIPLIIGVTAREFGAQVFGTPTVPEELRRTISNVMGSFSPQALASYGLADGGQGNSDVLHGTAADQWTADLNFRCPVVTQGAWHGAAQNPTWEYEFAHAIPGQEAQGAVHSSDLPYVFGYFPKEGNIAGNFTDADEKLADLIESYWTNFAKTGDPNSASVPTWPQLGTSQSYIQFSQEGKVVPSTGLRGAQCGVYREMLVGRLKRAK